MVFKFLKIKNIDFSGRVMADSSRNKRVFVNKEQKEALVEFIENNPILKHPPKLTNKITKKKIANVWEELAIHLNKIGEVTGGALKDASTWKKTWIDLKSNIKKKVSENKKYESGTGGGTPLPEPQSSDDYEAKIKEMLDPMEIEGDTTISESEVIFEIIGEPEFHNQKEESVIDSVNVPGPSKEPKNQKPSVQGATVTKSKRLTETLQISNKISQEIELKTQLKKEYYKQKIDILKENTRIKQEKLRLKQEKLRLKKEDIAVKKEDIAVKNEIAATLKQIAQNLIPCDIE